MRTTYYLELHGEVRPGRDDVVVVGAGPSP